MFTMRNSTIRRILSIHSKGELCQRIARCRHHTYVRGAHCSALLCSTTHSLEYSGGCVGGMVPTLAFQQSSQSHSYSRTRVGRTRFWRAASSAVNGPLLVSDLSE